MGSPNQSPGTQATGATMPTSPTALSNAFMSNRPMPQMGGGMPQMPSSGGLQAGLGTQMPSMPALPPRMAPQPIPKPPAPPAYSDGRIPITSWSQAIPKGYTPQYSIQGNYFEKIPRPGDRNISHR